MIPRITGFLLTIALGGAVAGGGAFAQPPATSPMAPDSLDGTTWKLSAWTGRTLVKDTEITASFRGSRLAGSAGCNRYITSYQVKGSDLSVKPEIASTMRACVEPLMKQEQAFFKALKEVRQYSIADGKELQLVYRAPDGLGTLTFTRVPENERPKQ